MIVNETFVREGIVSITSAQHAQNHTLTSVTSTRYTASIQQSPLNQRIGNAIYVAWKSSYKRGHITARYAETEIKVHHIHYVTNALMDHHKNYTNTHSYQLTPRLYIAIQWDIGSVMCVLPHRTSK